ncbi:hypothetical protein D3C81_2058900 [compost metagenome]
MRQRALAAFDGAVDDFELGGADVLAPDDAAVQRADVIGGVVAGNVLGADEVHRPRCG